MNILEFNNEHDQVNIDNSNYTGQFLYLDSKIGDLNDEEQFEWIKERYHNEFSKEDLEDLVKESREGKIFYGTEFSDVTFYLDWLICFIYEYFTLNKKKVVISNNV